MDIEISLDEPGELRCSDLELPLLTSERLNEVVMLHLMDMKENQWALLAMGKVDSDTFILLSDMCHNIIERVNHLVLDVVAPQVYGWTWGQSLKESASDHNEASVTMNRIESPHQERNFHTVTKDDIQASLGDSLHLCLGEMLDVAAERSDNTNQLLQLVAEEVAKEVNRKLADITQPTSSRQAEESLASPADDMVYHVVKILETCLAQNCKREATKGSLTWSQSSKQSLYLTSVTPFESENEFPQGVKTRLAVVTDNQQEVSPARELKGQQQEAAWKPLSFVDKVRRYFKRRSSKQTPACEVTRLDNASTPLRQKKPKRPAIIGMLSAVARILRKPFTCNCVRSQDDN